MTEIAHAVLSASGSTQWLSCPGSRKAQEGYEDKSSVFAVEGSRAHELADICLKDGGDAQGLLGEEIMGEDIPQEMCDYVQEYLDYVRSFEGGNTKLFTEQRVDFSNVVEGGFGTLDAAVLEYATGLCHIFDLKYGKGVSVFAFENTQAQLYALGLLNDLGWMDAIKSFRIHIVQPRKDSTTTWDVTVKELELFAAFATERSELAMTDSAPRVPGEKQCEWCKAKADCGVLATFVEETIMAEFDDLNLDDPKKIGNNRKKTIIDNKKLIEKFLDAVEASIFEEINDGGTFPGYKLVHGRSNRKWSADAEEFLIEKLGDTAYKRKLLTITDAEKLLGKGKLDEFTVKPEGKPTLALESDKRDAINDDVTDEFGIIPD